MNNLIKTSSKWLVYFILVGIMSACASKKGGCNCPSFGAKQSTIKTGNA